MRKIIVPFLAAAFMLTGCSKDASVKSSLDKITAKINAAKTAGKPLPKRAELDTTAAYTITNYQKMPIANVKEFGQVLMGNLQIYVAAGNEYVDEAVFQTAFTTQVFETLYMKSITMDMPEADRLQFEAAVCSIMQNTLLLTTSEKPKTTIEQKQELVNTAYTAMDVIWPKLSPKNRQILLNAASRVKNANFNEAMTAQSEEFIKKHS